jgi:hypothetical protein
MTASIPFVRFSRVALSTQRCQIRSEEGTFSSQHRLYCAEYALHGQKTARGAPRAVSSSILTQGVAVTTIEGVIVTTGVRLAVGVRVGVLVRVRVLVLVGVLVRVIVLVLEFVGVRVGVTPSRSTMGNASPLAE